MSSFCHPYIFFSAEDISTLDFIMFPKEVTLSNHFVS